METLDSTIVTTALPAKAQTVVRKYEVDVDARTLCGRPGLYRHGASQYS
jgi:hypothetical protein